MRSMQSRWFTHSVFLLLFLAISACPSRRIFADQNVSETQGSPDQSPWYQPFHPLREFHVLPAGKGDGKSLASPMSFQKALESAKPGDLYWLHEGTYKGLFEPTHDGTEKNPIVFRAAAGESVVIQGAIHANAAFNWFWGLEITDPDGIAASGGVEMLKPGIRLINNIIHDQLGKVGVGAWQQGKEHVVYGNIIYHQIPNSNNPHNLYIQNDYQNVGYKYVINNIILDAADATPDTYNVHGYTQSGLITGLYFESNIIKNGKFLIGGYNLPADNEIVRNNCFFDSTVLFGFRRPTQVQFQNNYLVHTTLSSEWFWGSGETQFHQTTPNTYTGNQILDPTGECHVRFRTSAYLPTGRCEGCPAIQHSDTWDNNQYSAPFHATFFANNKDLGLIGFQEWKKASIEAGKSFDAHSVEVPIPTTVKTVLFKNEYDPTRAHLAVYNWTTRAQITLDLSEFLAPGTKYAIYRAKEFGKTPVASGVYQTPIELTVGAGGFSAFVVVQK